MNIKYRRLKAFTLAARLGSFVKGADAMAVTQPSFSILIRELENELGVELFERTTRTCRLTPTGVSLYQELSPVLQDLEDVYQNAKDISAGKRGTLSLAVVPSVACGIVTEALGDFHREYPGVRIAMREGNIAAVVAAVKQSDVELGVACLFSPDEELSFKPLFHDRLVVVAPSDHPIVGAPLSWQTVAKYPLILQGAGTAERAIQLSRTAIVPTFEVAHMATAVAMVRQGMGITVIPGSALEGLNTEGLDVAPIPGELARRDLGVIYRRHKRLSVAATCFIDILQATVPDVLRLPEGKQDGHAAPGAK
jgi:LysR family carnitine catabolism transcriptional activator